MQALTVIDKRLGPLGFTGVLLSSIAWLILALYLAPLVLALLLYWPPTGSLPFSLAWAASWTLVQALASAVLATVLGWPLGILAGFYSLRLAYFTALASLAPFMSPVVVAALGLRSLYEGTPLEFIARGWSGVIVLHAYFNIGLVALFVAAAAASTERSIIEHARLIGLRGPSLWLRVLIPLTARAAAYASLIVFIYSLTSAAPLVVKDARYKYYTIEAWLYTLYHGFPSSHGLIPVIALAEVAAVALVATLVVRVAERIEASPLAVRGRGYLPLRGPAKALAQAYSLCILVFLYAPIASLALEAVKANPSILFSRATAGPGLVGVVLNSLVYLAVVAAVSIPLGAAAATSKSLGVAALASIAVAPVAYGVTATIYYYRTLSSLLGVEATSRLLIILAHTAAALPLASRLLEAGKARVPREVEETMQLIGLRGAVYLSHWLRAVAPATITAAGFAAAASLGEFGASIVVSVPETWSLTVLVYKLIASGRFFSEACLAALLLEAMSLASIAIPLYIAIKRSS